MSALGYSLNGLGPVLLDTLAAFILHIIIYKYTQTHFCTELVTGSHNFPRV